MTVENKNHYFETPRLVLRKFVAEDGDAVYQLRSDPEFMRHLLRTETREESDLWIKYVSNYWKYNVGFWAVVLKKTNEVIGWCGTWSRLDYDIGKMEIGYAVSPKYAGNGFAAEAARFALEYTFAKRGAKKVYAIAAPANKASFQVMKRIGMEIEGQRFFASYGLEMIYYGISRQQFFAESAAIEAPLDKQIILETNFRAELFNSSPAPAAKLLDAEIISHPETDELLIVANIEDGSREIIHIYDPKNETWMPAEFAGLTLLDAYLIIRKRRAVPDA